MKWFKHFNDLLESPEMQMCLDKHGYAGPYAFIRLLEMLSKHLNIDDPGTFVESKRDVFSNLFPKSCPKTGKKILDFFQNVGWIKFEIYGKEIIFNCDIIKELADEFTKRCLAEKAKKEY